MPSPVRKVARLQYLFSFLQFFQYIFPTSSLVNLNFICHTCRMQGLYMRLNTLSFRLDDPASISRVFRNVELVNSSRQTSPSLTCQLREDVKSSTLDVGSEDQSLCFILPFLVFTTGIELNFEVITLALKQTRSFAIS